jgi:hypothetical protein
VQGHRERAKTHTIANIICHYLRRDAECWYLKGRASARGAAAEDSRGIATTDGGTAHRDREGIRQFQASIEAIQHQVSTAQSGALPERKSRR